MFACRDSFEPVSGLDWWRLIFVFGQAKDWLCLQIPEKLNATCPGYGLLHLTFETDRHSTRIPGEPSAKFTRSSLRRNQNDSAVSQDKDTCLIKPALP